VKHQVYAPDWTTTERAAYTNLLFDLLAQLLPAGMEGSVSTLPCGVKGLVTTPEEWAIIRANLWHCVEHIARVSQLTGRKLHLGLEPEPMCLLECSGEVLHFFDRMRADHRNDPRLGEHLGVNYDTCHFAVEFEEPQNAIACLQQHGIMLSKFHLSNALKVRPTAETREALRAFANDVYLHQVVVRRADGQRVIYRDLSGALAAEPVEGRESNVEGNAVMDHPHSAIGNGQFAEWRIHFHVPLHSAPTPLFDNTADHVLGVLDLLVANPALCPHLEMETYTWEVLPPELGSRSVVDQLVAEYEWTLARLKERGL